MITRRPLGAIAALLTTLVLLGGPAVAAAARAPHKPHKPHRRCRSDGQCRGTCNAAT